MNLFAHAGEPHEDAVESTTHLLAEPYMAIPLFILILIAVFYALKALGVSTATNVMILLAILLLTGLLTYTVVPALSVFALTVGITSALFVTLSTLAGK